MFIFLDIGLLLLSAMLLWARFDSLTATDMFETAEWRMKAGEKGKKKRRESTSRFLYDSNADELRRVPCSNKQTLKSRFLIATTQKWCFFFISQGLTNMHTRTTVVSAAEANCLNGFFFRHGPDVAVKAASSRLCDIFSLISVCVPMPPSIRLSCKHHRTYLSQSELLTYLVAVRWQVVIDFSKRR